MLSLFALSTAVGLLFPIAIMSSPLASSNSEVEESLSSTATCTADAASMVRAFGNTTTTRHAALGACYTVIAADLNACSIDIWRRPRFAVLLKRIDDTHSKLKIITGDEVIEAENYLTDQNPKDREYIRVRINDKFISFNACSTALSEVNNLVTVNYTNYLTGVELQNADFWIRFNGTLMEMRCRRSDERAICGRCGNFSPNYVANVRTQLAENGLLKDEHESCRLRVDDPPQGKCEASVANGVQEFNAKHWTSAPQLNASVNGCYTIIAADASSCSNGFSGTFDTTAQRPRYAILMRRIKDVYSKVKVITDSEIIEMERLIDEHTPAEQRLLRVIMNGERIPYNAYSMAHSVVDNLCTVEFMSTDFSVVELQNRDFWLRFNGMRLELRLLKHVDASAATACGACHKTRSNSSQHVVDAGVLSAHELEAGHNMTHDAELTLLRASLAWGGFFKDETVLCQETLNLVRLMWKGNETALIAAPDERTTVDFVRPINHLISTSDDIDMKTRTRPITAIIIDAQPTRVCLSTRAIKHCAFPARPIFLKRVRTINDNAGCCKVSTERVEFVCAPRMHSTAQQLLDFADRRRRLLGRIADASKASEIDSDLRAIERDIEQIQRNNAINRISVPGDSMRHHIPDYCSLVTENTT